LERTALLVLGMHRAGTSALTRVLSLRGAALPRRLLPPNAGNASGYWEPRYVVDLNDRVLAAFGLTWDDPFAGLQLPADDVRYAPFLDEARALLEADYADAALFALKDPRCTLLRPFWERTLEASGARCRAVVMMRPWREVVSSLVRRDGSSAAGAGLAYVGYGLAAADAVAAGASVATYAQLLGDWRSTTDRIAAEQHFAWPVPPAADDIAAFLRDTSADATSVDVPGDVARWAEAVWAWNARAAEGQAVTLHELEPVRAGLRALAGQVAPLLQDRVRRQQDTTVAYQHAVQERDHALQVYRETDERLRTTQADFAALELELAERSRALEAQRAAHDALQAEHEALRGAQQALQQERDSVQTQRDDLLALYRDTDALLQQTQQDYVERDHECVRLHDALQATQQEREALHHDLSRVLGSRSWRLTRPLRAIARLLRGESPGVGSFMERARHGNPASAVPRAAASLLPRARRIPSGLRTFLEAEFGEATCRDVVARIERYHLPLPVHDVRPASDVTCSEDDARAWAQAIAARAKPAPDGAPDVSIIVPVYNQVPFTLACLDALLAHASRYTFEVLIGDDASTDATAAAFAAGIAGVRHVRHATNLGFVRNCNATAAEARGRHVVFLNNDTLVLPGWLDELVDTLDDNPDIGLAGSKLIYPDGRLQECGAIVWRDGSAWNYGRLADPRRPEFCYRRDVDYVSGASIALPRALWEQLGGFDEAFVPAYAEDADLAFRVRAAGLRTVVQPLSQLLHFEGISSGTDLGSGAKAYQVENLRKLHERWADVLASHRDNADQPELEKERAVTRRVLFVDKCTPTPREDAGSVVADEIMQGLLDLGCKVTFVPEDNFAHMGEATRALQRRGIEAIYHPAYAGMAAFVAARQEPFDVLFLHRFEVGEKHLDLLRRRYPAAKVLFLNADMHWLREMREAELAGDDLALAQAQRTRERELAVVGRVDVALAHSDHERALLQAALPERNVALFPLVHDPVEAIAPLAGRQGVCFVGGFRHPPNADAIRWFVETAWPRIVAAVPGARLDIVGSHMPPEVRALGERPGVRAVGFVDDLDALLAHCRLTVAPLRYGAGAKGKVAASLAQGVPTVCTPVAAEGMLLTPGVDVLVGDTPEALAEHVIALLRDDALWTRLSVAGVDYARRITSRTSARHRLRTLLDA
jgi:GT2 family glycosyltransferase